MSAIPADLRIASPWRVAAPAALALILAIALVYRQTAQTMMEVWSTSDTFAHAWLVAPISIWLIWRQRATLERLDPRPQPWLLLPMLVVALAWFAADLVVVNSPAQFAFVSLLILAVPAVLGLQVARAVLFPLLFLYFSVPFGEFMLEPMMEWTADFVVTGLQVTGIPVHREGLNFIVPNGRWSVVEECSGVRYLIASFMVGALFAYLNYQSWRRRTVFIAFSLLVPIVANWIRAYLIVLVGYLSDNRIAAGVDHILYGWIFFGLVIFVMFMVGMRWAEPDAPAPGGPAVAGRPAALQAQARGIGLMAGAAVLVALSPHLAVWGLEQSERARAVTALELPAPSAPGWTSLPAPPEAWSPTVGRPAASAARVYESAEGRVTVHVGYFRGQNAQSKLVSSHNTIVQLNDRTWRIGGTGVVEVPRAGQAGVWRRTGIVATQYNRAQPGAHLTAWHAYWIDGRWTASDVQAKLRNAAARLGGRGDDGAVVVLHTDVPSSTQSDALLRAFMRDNLGTIEQWLARTRDSR